MYNLKLDYILKVFLYEAAAVHVIVTLIASDQWKPRKVPV